MEIGQALFGCPTGQYECPRWIGALLNDILSEIERVFWNRNQKEWDGYEDPEIDGIEFRKYWWGDEDAPEAALPNFKFENVEIRWYKYPGRGMSVNVELTHLEWCEWFDRCIALIQKSDDLT